MKPALTLSCSNESFTFDDDEYLALSEMNFLYGTDGAKLGRMMVNEATLSEREVVNLRMFLARVRPQLETPLVVYDHGRGIGTVCFQHKGWYELVKGSGIRYQKPTPRYVKGQKGKLASIDDVVYAKGRSVTAKDPAAKPQVLGDVSAVMSALEKLDRAVSAALAGASLSSSPRETFEYL
jgi:transposase